MFSYDHVLPSCASKRYCSNKQNFSPAGVKEDIDERGGDGRQRVWVQGHDAEVVLGD